MIEVTSAIQLPESELEERFIRSRGPGGQNVNKVNTAVQLRLDVASSASLPEDVKERLARLAGRRMTEEGILTIEAQRYRTRERNRVDARERLVKLIQRAAQRQRPRVRTGPSKGAIERRLGEKHRQSLKKQARIAPAADQE